MKTELNFNLVSLFFAATVALTVSYHLYGVFVPSLRPDYPWQRHVFWVIFGILGIYYLLNRKWYLIPIIAVLFVQQWAGHGVQFINIWVEQGRMSPIDLFPVVNVSLILFAYSYDIYKNRKNIQ